MPFAGSSPVWPAMAVGGALGSAARYWLGLVLPDDPVSSATIVVNVVGAFALGVLVARPMSEWAAALWRTGVLGAFTTFSAMAVQTATLGSAVGGGYVGALMLAGVGAAWAGLRIGRWRYRGAAP